MLKLVCKRLFSDFFGSEMISQMNSFVLTRTASKAFRDNRHDLHLWKIIYTRSLDLINQMTSQEISCLLNLFSRLKYRYMPFLDAVSQHLPNISHSCDTSEITYILHSLARLKYNNNLFAYNIFFKHISNKIAYFSPKELSLIVESYSMVNYSYTPLLRIIRSRLIELNEKLEPWQLSTLLNSLIKLGYLEEKIILVLLQRSLRRIDEFSMRDLSLICNSFKKLHLRNKFVIEVVLDAVLNKQKSFDSHSVALILNYFSRVNDNTSNQLFKILFQDIMHSIKKFDLHSICLVSAAYSKKNIKIGDLFEKIGDSVGKVSVNLTCRQVASLVYSFAQVNYLHGPLLKFGMIHAKTFLKDYTFDELLMLIHSYSKLNIDINEILLILIDFLPSYFEEKIESFKNASVSRTALIQFNFDEESFSFSPCIPEKKSHSSTMDINDFFSSSGDLPICSYKNSIHSWVWLIEAFAIWRINDSKAIEIIVNQLVARFPELCLKKKISILHSLSSLFFKHNKLLSIVLDSLEEGEVCDFTQKDITHIGNALKVFGLSDSYKKLSSIVKSTSQIDCETPSNDFIAKNN